jgi:hypothetical protein
MLDLMTGESVCNCSSTKSGLSGGFEYRRKESVPVFELIEREATESKLKRGFVSRWNRLVESRWEKEE